MKIRKTLTKKAIEKMATEIISLLEKTGVAGGVAIFCNNKMITIKTDFSKKQYDENYFSQKYIVSVKYNENPFDYFEYANPHHILSMSFDGEFYEIVNYFGGEIMKKFDDILSKYGVYYECGDAWNLSCFPINDDIKVETTEYHRNPKPTYINSVNLWMFPDLEQIVNKWREYQKAIGDYGSCVLGAGFHASKNNQEFFISPCSRYQGSLSWETNIDDIKNLLEKAGYENIWFDYGRMD